jgi:hypothetical protein
VKSDAADATTGIRQNLFIRFFSLPKRKAKTSDAAAHMRVTFFPQDIYEKCVGLCALWFASGGSNRNNVER